LKLITFGRKFCRAKLLQVVKDAARFSIVTVQSTALLDLTCFLRFRRTVLPRLFKNHLMKQALLLFSVVISSHVFSQHFSWAEGWGSENNSDIATAISAAPDGTVLVTGYFSGTVDFDPGPDVFNLAAQSEDAFISCTDPSGNLLWVKRFGGDSIQRGNAIAHDSDGNSYITGLFQGTVDFNPGPGVFNLTTSRNSIYICKLDPNGNFVWAKQFVNESAAAASRVYGLAVNADQQVWLTGTFRGVVDFDPGAPAALFDAGNKSDLFVASFDTDGNYLWAKQVNRATSMQTFEPASISTDAAGNVYVAGNFDGTIDFDPGAGVYSLVVEGEANDAGGVDDAFIFKLDSNGNFMWAKQLAGPDISVSTGIAADPAGNVYITGFFIGMVDFDPGIAVYEIDVTLQVGHSFVLKLDTDGSLVWVKTTRTLSESIRLDAAGNTYTTGSFGSTADFDPSAATYYLSTAGDADIFISKLDTDGNFIWARKFGGANRDNGMDVAIDASQNVYGTGYFSATADFDTGIGYWPVSSAGAGTSFDSYLVKLSSCVPDTGTDFISATCGSMYTWPVNGTTYDESGVYHYISVNAAGCDSVLSLELDIAVLSTLVASLNQNGDTLFATPDQPADSYQWGNCADNSPISGATNAWFVPAVPGMYYVWITLGNCVSVSDCVNFGGVGIAESAQTAIRLYPNPVRDELTLFMEAAAAEIEVRAINGQLVFADSGVLSGGKITTQNWFPGIYLVKISTGHHTAVHRIVKE